MSGLEVAGLIFGVIPLFISAFEHYEEGIRPFKRFFNYEQEVARYRARLLIQYTTYIQTLEYLLTDFVDKDELENMVTKGYCDLWKDYHLSVKLEQQLGKAYESFCFLLTELRTDMEALASVLDIERQGQATGPQLETLLATHKPKQSLPRQSPQTFKHLYNFNKKLKFSHKGRHIKPLLDSLERHNRELGGFIEKSKKLGKARSKASKRAFEAPLHRVREGAERLHRVLSEAWTCPQHVEHIVNLLLESRISTRGSNTTDESPLESVAFSLALPSLLSPPIWRSLQIHVLYEPDPTAHAPSTVSFAINPPTVAKIDATNLPEVNCLCTTLEGSNLSLGTSFCLDHRGRLLKNHPLPQQYNVNHNRLSGAITSLKDILSRHSSGTRNRKPFTSSQACLLALTVASSFLQLRSTPWLGGQWRAEDVYFIHDNTTHNAVDIERPFLQQTYVNPTSSLRPMAGKTTITRDNPSMDDKYSFLGLGIMLLEIFSGEPFSSQQSSAIGDPKIADLVKANDWIQQEKGNMTKAFYNAICECISWFANPRADLRNDEFKREFIDQLIIPLRDELKLYA